MIRPAFLAVPFALALAGCPGSLDDPGRFTGHLGDACPDIPSLLATTCAIGGCHTADMPSVGLDLASADIPGRLAGKHATGGVGVLVDPTDPVSSVLYTKLTTSPPFGARMPLNHVPFDDVTVGCVLAWLEEGGDAGAP
jgi:hypothetical protein